MEKKKVHDAWNSYLLDQTKPNPRLHKYSSHFNIDHENYYFSPVARSQKSPPITNVTTIASSSRTLSGAKFRKTWKNYGEEEEKKRLKSMTEAQKESNL